MTWRALGPDLFCFADSCRVYLLRFGERAVVVDAGAGAWCDHLDELGGTRVEAVVLTHVHRDQCCGLYRVDRAAIPALTRSQVVAPAGEAPLLDGQTLAAFWRDLQRGGCPTSYAAPRRPVPVDGLLAGDSERCWGPVRLCAVATPGHTRGVLSYVVPWGRRQLAFCGDAVTAGGCVHEPFHLEWGHWTPEGALAAWYGLERLAGNRLDALLPSHGEPVLAGARRTVRVAQRRLLALVRAKAAIAPGEASRWLDLEPLACGARRVSPHLYAFGGNGYLLAASRGAGLVVDPTKPDAPALEALVAETGITPEVATASHYHVDHCDALDDVRRRWGARVWLHPWVAEPIRDRDRLDLPWLPAASVAPDRVLPEEGSFRWREYRFSIRPYPGQTWWRCAFDAEVDGRRVLFSGDSFQPPTRWNGTGGFCACNGSRFDGFARSARAALTLAPDLVCNGHGCVYAFAAGHYRRIARWSAAAAKAVRDLCPSGSLADYDPRACRWEPFVVRARRGEERRLDFVCTNQTRRTLSLAVTALPDDGLECAPPRRRLTVAAGAAGRARFALRVGDVAPGRYLLVADVAAADRFRAEACAALVDVA